MTSEAMFTSRLRQRIRDLLPNAVVLKHADAFTKGIPDLSITVDRQRTTWIEVKLLRGRLDKLQLEMAKRMGAWYIVWNPEYHHGWIFRADELDAVKLANVTNDHDGVSFGQLCDKICRFV